MLNHQNTSNDATFIKELLDAIETGFRHDKFSGAIYENQLVVQFEQFGGIDVLEELQKHPDLEVTNKIEKIADAYFNDDDNDQQLLEEARTAASMDQQSEPTSSGQENKE